MIMTPYQVIIIGGILLNLIVTVCAFIISVKIRFNDLKHLTESVDEIKGEVVVNRKEITDIAIALTKQVTICSEVRKNKRC